MTLRGVGCLCILLAAAGTAGADVYKYYDSNGNLVLSDTLPKDSESAAKAEKVQERPVMTLPALAPGKARAGARDDKKPAADVSYQVIIQSPTAEETYQRVGEPIPVAYSVTPSLEQGDQVDVLLDGAASDSGISVLSPDQLDRGAHTLTVQVVNAKGKVLASASATFYIQQPGKFGPNAPKPKPTK